jgi:predicted RNA-binding protein YlqC (UPF0109 family)
LMAEVGNLAKVGEPAGASEFAEPGNRLEDAGEGEPDGNRVVGARARDVLAYIARWLVDAPDAVVVDAEPDRGGGVMLRLHVDPSDMGRVIGRGGRVANAIRTVVRAAGACEGVNARVDIVD